MHAVIAERPGGPDVLTLAVFDDPEPGRGEVRIAVESASVTFIDTQLRAGHGPGPAAHFPIVLGNGVGGVVELLGGDVDPDWAGTRVVTATGGSDGYADLALAQVEDLHLSPTPSRLRRQQRFWPMAAQRWACATPRESRPGSLWS